MYVVVDVAWLTGRRLLVVGLFLSPGFLLTCVVSGLKYVH